MEVIIGAICVVCFVVLSMFLILRSLVSTVLGDIPKAFAICSFEVRVFLSLQAW